MKSKNNQNTPVAVKISSIFFFSLFCILFSNLLFILHELFIILSKQFLKLFLGNFTEINVILSQRLKSVLNGITERGWFVSYDFFLFFHCTVYEPILVSFGDICELILWKHSSKVRMHLNVLLTLADHLLRWIQSELFEVIAPLNVPVCW